MPEGKSVITLNGIKALTFASATDKSLKPATFKVSDQDPGDIYPGIDVNDLNGVWYSAPISGVLPLNDNTVMFILDIPPDKAVKYGKTFGLYLEDGTLFAIAKPPYPFPPLVRQRFKVQFVWEQIEAVMNFEDMPFYEFDQDVAAMSGFSLLGKALLELSRRLSYTEGKLSEIQTSKANQEDVETLFAELKNEIQSFKISVFSAISLLSKALLELSQKLSWKEDRA